MLIRPPLVVETLNSIPLHSGGVGVYTEKLLEAYVEELPEQGGAFGLLDTWQGEAHWCRNFPRYRNFYGLPAPETQDVILHIVSGFRSAFRNSAGQIGRFKSCRVVATHHDFIDLDYPWLFNEDELRIRRDAYNAFRSYEGFIVPWRGVADRLSGDYNIAGDRIATIPHGNSQHLEIDADFSVVPEGRYILYSGKLYPHKNWRRLLRACAAIADDFRNREVKLALVSADANSMASELREEIEGGGIQDIVEILPFVTNSQLAGLFAECSGYVFPSMAEGFGMPAFEVQAFGAPICLSDIPVFRDVMSIGDYPATWFDPFSLESMAEGMRRFLERIDEPRPTPFVRTWRTVAREHLDFIYGLAR